MSIQLLDKTRKINQLLHDNRGDKVEFRDICEVLSVLLNSHTMVFSRKGKVLGEGYSDSVEKLQELVVAKMGEYIDPTLNERLLGILSTKENVNLTLLGFSKENSQKFQAIVVPINISGERLGTLFIYKCSESFDIEDIILSEYATTVVGLELLRSEQEESAEEQRKIQVVKAAIKTLSASELEAVKHIFEELDGDEGVLVASKVADRSKITRSVVVNAVRKLESAGIIESRSSGMKGTYIRVTNHVIFDELN